MTEKGVAFETVHYIDEPLSANELKGLLRRAGLRPHDIVRKNEAAYRDHVLDKDLCEKELVEVMAKHPELIQRPIVVRGEKVVLARPAARLSELGADL